MYKRQVHVSGHACQEELKLILGITKPKYFIPVHGEYRHLLQHAKLGEKMGVAPENIYVLENGKMLEMDAKQAKISSKVPSGRVLVDGLGVGDVGNIVPVSYTHLWRFGLSKRHTISGFRGQAVVCP